jgi:methylthioribose-1-phosphate isomerase
MLLNLYKKKWLEGMKLEQMDDMQGENIETMRKMGKLGKEYIKWVEQEMEKT